MDRTNRTRRSECQVGLICEQGTTFNTNDYWYSVRPVTAKHNVANGEVEGAVDRFRMAELRVLKSTGMVSRGDVELDFADGGSTYRYADPDECSIAWGDQVWVEELVLPCLSMLRWTKGCDCCMYGKRGYRFHRISA
jgi:hypothetical protein